MWQSGLSPLARGTLKERSQMDQASRFIPAGAGNTPSDGWYSGSLPVYPRWRGEHAPKNPAMASWNGLSPLARGTR